jgi:trigger factor
MDLQIEIEDLGGLKKALNIEVPIEELTEAIKAGFETIKETAVVEGFRKGKVPENVLKQKFSKDVLDDVSKRVIDKTYPMALKQSGIKVMGQPQIDVLRLNEDSPFVYRAMVAVMPQISPETYKGMETKIETVEITEEEIEKNLEMLRGRNANYAASGGAAEEGDKVTISVDCFIDGKPLAASKGEKKDYSFELGQGASLPEFEELSVGAKAGDEREFTKPFPLAYHDKNVAGKTAEFKIKIKSVKKKVLVPLDDDFAKDLGCKDLDDLNSRVRFEITSLKENKERDRVKRELLDKIVDANDFEIPESLEQKYYTQLMSNMLDGVRSGKINPLGYNAASNEAKERYREIALRQAKSDIILDVIADNENIEVSSDEIDAAIVNIGKARGEDPATVRASLEEKNAIVLLGDSIMRDKVFDKLMGTELETPEKV